VVDGEGVEGEVVDGEVEDPVNQHRFISHPKGSDVKSRTSLTTVSIDFFSLCERPFLIRVM
jgi:hypothetical protein